MKLDQIRAFCAVVEQGGLQEAAEHLHKTNAAISAAIKHLEASLSVKLFDRSQYRLALTNRGQLVYQQSKQMLREANHIKIMCQEFTAGVEPELVIAADEAFDLSIVAPSITDLQTSYPNTQLRWLAHSVSGAFTASLSGSADIGIGLAPAELLDHSKGHFIELAPVDYITCLRPDALSEQQIILQDSGKQTEKQIYGTGLSKNTILTSSLLQKKMLILAGLGWGALPKHMVCNEFDSGQLVERRSTQSPKMSYFACIAKDKVRGKAAQYLWSLLLDLAVAR